VEGDDWEDRADIVAHDCPGLELAQLPSDYRLDLEDAGFEGTGIVRTAHGGKSNVFCCNKNGFHMKMRGDEHKIIL
jgi:hypothetical protein